MWSDTTIVFLIVGATAILMASNRLRFDIIALLVVLALILSGILTVGEALSGFGSSVVMMVACLLVVGEMLDRTGVADAIGVWILKHGGTGETRLCIVIMLAAGVLGAVMSSTAVVAIFIPIVFRIAAETNVQASRLLMPMSYAALISGMLTLIATPPNLVVSEELHAAGYQAFGFFSFTPVGIAVLFVAIAYMLTIGNRLLPRREQDEKIAPGGRRFRDMMADYNIDNDYQVLAITEGSNLQNTSIANAGLESRYKVRILGLARRGTGHEAILPVPAPSVQLLPGDRLLVVGAEKDLAGLVDSEKLKPLELTERDVQRWQWELGSATVLVHPESELLGKTLSDAEFRSQFKLHVVGMRREGAPVADYLDTPLGPSDSLMVMGTWSSIRQLQSMHHDFVVLELPREHTNVVPAYRRMPWSLGILTVMVLLSIFQLIPLVTTVIIAALAAVATRCLTMEDAYRSIHWGSLVLVAGMLPLADALDKTGGTTIIVNALMNGVGDAGPGTMLTVLFFLTAALGLFLSNTASAVLVAPVAIFAAESLGISPYPFAVAVLIAASAAFITPVSTPVVTLVVEPGRYSFMDFVRVGMPLLLLTWLTTLVVAPLVFPYTAS